MEFEYSKEEYSVGDFYHSFKNSLPKLVIVTQGYLGEIGIETYDRLQVLRIETHSAQKRVVAEVLHSDRGTSGLEGKQLSIPVDIQSRFRVVKPGHKSKKGELLSTIIENHPQDLEKVVVEFSQSDDQTVVVGSEERNKSSFCRLRLIKTYEDLYLLGNPISGGRLYAKMLSVPVYLKEMRLSVITGVKGYDTETYQEYLDGMAVTIKNKLRFDTTSGNKDIAVYSETSSDETEYTYRLPTDYYNVEMIKRPDIKPRKLATGNYEQLSDKTFDSVCLYQPLSFEKELSDVLSKSLQSKVPPPLMPKPSRNSVMESRKPPPAIPQSEQESTDISGQQDISGTSSSFGRKEVDTFVPTTPPPIIDRKRIQSQISGESKFDYIQKENKTITKEQRRQNVPDIPPKVDRTYKPQKRKFEFECEEKSYSVKEFYNLFGDSLPKIVKVTQGYHGHISLETFATGEIFRIHKSISQKRVIAKFLADQSHKGYYGKRLSIPVNFNHQFRVVKQWKKSGKNLSLEEIVQKLPYEKSITVKFSKVEGNKTLLVGSSERDTSHFPNLEVIDVYDDHYLLGNPISDGCLYGRIVSIPAYLPELKLAMVTGIKGCPENVWKDYVLGLEKAVKEKINFDECQGNKDIAIYEEDEVKVDSNFAFVSPNVYTNIEQLLQAKSSKDYHRTSRELSADVYEEIPADKVKDLTCIYEPVAIMATEKADDKNVRATETADDKMASLKKQSSVETLKTEVLDVSKCTIKDIGDALCRLKLNKYVKRFEDEMIDGTILKEMDEEFLQKDFGFRRHEAIKLMKFVREGHVPS